MSAKNYTYSELLKCIESEKDEQVIQILNEIDDVNDTIAFGTDNIVLRKACECNRIEVVRHLINRGVDINKKCVYGISALSSASREGNCEVTLLLIDSGIDMVNLGGHALLNAAFKRHFEIVQILVEAGVNVNHSNQDTGWTALHYACSANNLEIIEILLNNGADENIKNKDGKTAIDVAKSEDIKEFIKNYNSTKFVLK